MKDLQNAEPEELVDRVPIRIEIKVQCTGSNLILEPQLNRIEAVALQLLDEAVEAFNDMARIGPPSMIQHDALLKVGLTQVLALAHQSGPRSPNPATGRGGHRVSSLRL